MRYRNTDGVTSFDALAQEFGISRTAAQAIEARALAKIRRILNRRGFKAEDFFDDFHKLKRD